MVTATRINHNYRIVLSWCGNSLTVLVERDVGMTVSRIPDSEHSTVFVARLADRREQLLPVELPLLDGRTARRRDEFSSGRYCARRAMAARGMPEGPIASHADRSPLWPSGVKGSLTHSRQLVGAAVSGTLEGLGIDLEHFGRLSRRAAERILTDVENGQLDVAGEDEFLRQATIVFSAKEAVYKAIYPIAGLYVGYREVRIMLKPEHAEFRASYLGHNMLNSPLEGGVGHWGFIEEAVLTRFEIGGRR